MKTVLTSIRLPQKLYKWLKNKAEKEHRTVSNALIDTLIETQKTGEWKRKSELSEEQDDRYECSFCGNVVHYRSKIDLYTFNSYCGRCGSYNGKDVWKNR